MRRRVKEIQTKHTSRERQKTEIYGQGYWKESDRKRATRTTGRRIQYRKRTENRERYRAADKNTLVRDAGKQNKETIATLTTETGNKPVNVCRGIELLGEMIMSKCSLSVADGPEKLKSVHGDINCKPPNVRECVHVWIDTCTQRHNEQASRSLLDF